MSQRDDLLQNKNAFSWLKDVEIDASQIKKTLDTDVLIIGAGHAGTAAGRGAIEATPGTKVLIAEQQEKEKQYILGVGEIGHINSEWQKKRGVRPVDVDEFVNDWQLRNNNRTNYRLIRTYADNCGKHLTG